MNQILAFTERQKQYSKYQKIHFWVQLTQVERECTERFHEEIGSRTAINFAFIQVPGNEGIPFQGKETNLSGYKLSKY